MLCALAAKILKKYELATPVTTYRTERDYKDFSEFRGKGSGSFAAKLLPKFRKYELATLLYKIL